MGDDSDKKGFADLFGETRPAKGSDKKRHVISPSTRANGKKAGPHRNGREEEGDASGGPFRFPDPEETRLGGRSGVSDRQLRELARGEPAPEERIDLHGVRVEGGNRLLEGRFASARERGLRCVVVIHGRGKHSDTGEAVLRDQMSRWLSQGPASKHVLGFAPAPPALGGAGATLVLIRRAGGR